MTNFLVTGAAGFIGSSLAEKLTELNYEVVGIDSFFNNYSREIKEKNIYQLKNSSNQILYDFQFKKFNESNF